MHNPDYVPANATSCGFGVLKNSSYHGIDVNFNLRQIPPQDRKLADIFAEKIAAKEFFYGIELTARSYGPDRMVLDYNDFGSLLPLFTSIVWLGQDYWNFDKIADVESIRLAQRLYPKMVVLTHFTCYCINRKRLMEYLDLNFSNVLALRGDQVLPEQEYKYASDLVADIRKIREATISIGVGGYPEGHPDSLSLEEDLHFLLKKIAAGADFIITQICFSSAAIIQFIQSCREHGITVPIIIGVFVPEDFHTMKRAMEIAQVKMASIELIQYQRLENDLEKFQEYSVQKAVQMIREVLRTDFGVFGLQFFTMNKLKSVQKVLQKLDVKNTKIN